MYSLLFAWLFTLMTLPDHPIHVSVSEVEMRAGHLEWTARIYKDDLLLGLYGKKAKMELLNQEDQIKEDILRYLSKRIIVVAGNAPLVWRLADVQPDPEALWITLTAELHQRNTHSLTVQNQVLTETYKDQKNIVRFTIRDKTKNLIFEAGDREKVVSF